MKNMVNNCMDFLYNEIESMFKFWNILSWSTLLIGYSFLIVAYTLFGDPPIWLTIGGMIGITVTLANFFLAIVISVFFIVKGIQNKDKVLIKEKASISLVYLFVSGFMYFAITL